jgi:hypothetical protein
MTTPAGAHAGIVTALLEEGAWDTDSRIVPVQTSGSRPPLFIAHALYDEVFNIGVLKRTLGDDQPLYALRAVPGKLDYPSIEELAREYFREVQRLQPSACTVRKVCSGSATSPSLPGTRAGGHDVVFAVIDPRRHRHRLLRHSHQRRWSTLGRDGLVLRAQAAPLAIAYVPGGSDPSRDRPGTAPSRCDGAGCGAARHAHRHRDDDYWQSRRTRAADRTEWHDVEAPHRTLFQQPNADIIGALLARVVDHALRDGG